MGRNGDILTEISGGRADSASGRGDIGQSSGYRADRHGPGYRGDGKAGRLYGCWGIDPAGLYPSAAAGLRQDQQAKQVSAVRLYRCGVERRPFLDCRPSSDDTAQVEPGQLSRWTSCVSAWNQTLELFPRQPDSPAFIPLCVGIRVPDRLQQLFPPLGRKPARFLHL